MTDSHGQTPRPTHVVLEPPSRWTPLNLIEVWHFRDLLMRFVRRDLTLRYRQTALGVFWVVAQPLLAAGAFSLVFGKIANLKSDGVPYFLFAYAGMLGWNVFSSTILKISGSLVANQQLISKIFFPRLVLPLSTIGSSLIDFVVATGLMYVLLVFNGLWAGWATLLLPIWLLLMLACATGIGLAAAALAVPYRDVSYVLPVAVQILLFASPVAFSLSSVPSSAKAFVRANPLTGILEGFRWSLLGTPAPPVWIAVYSIVFAVGVMLAGGLIFARMQQRFADVI